MRAARCLAHGPPTDIVVADVPPPAPAPGEVVVQVAAAAVNFADVLIVANTYQVSVRVPFTPGSEFAGVVVAAAPDVSVVHVGDHVSGAVLAGAFAEQVVAPASGLTVLPAALDLREATAFGVAHSTAYHALNSVAGVKRGDWVAVLGAGGGVGLAAVELAHHAGAHVVAAASNDDKLDVCAQKGADALINYETEDLKERLRVLTGGGADVVIDPVGGRHSEAALRAMRWGGRYVCVGFASGEIPRIPLNLVLLKGVIVKGFEFGGFARHSPELVSRGSEELAGLLASGVLRPHICGVYPLEKAGQAMQSVADRRSTGKVLIDPTL